MKGKIIVYDMVAIQKKINRKPMKMTKADKQLLMCLDPNKKTWYWNLADAVSASDPDGDKLETQLEKLQELGLMYYVNEKGHREFSKASDKEEEEGECANAEYIKMTKKGKQEYNRIRKMVEV